MEYRKGVLLCCLASILLLQLLLTSGGHADVPMPGMRGYEYLYVISNIGDYPDYIFLTSSTIWGWEYTGLVDRESGSFGGGYKLDSFQLYAVKASDFNTDLFKECSSGDTLDCTGYCKGNSRIVSSGIHFPVSTLINDTIPLKQITVYLKVNSITDTSLGITRLRTVHQYSNGTSVEVPVEDISG